MTNILKLRRKIKNHINKTPKELNISTLVYFDNCDELRKINQHLKYMQRTNKKIEIENDIPIILNEYEKLINQIIAQK